MVVVMVVIVVVLVLVVLLELGHARLDLGLGEQPVGEENVLQRGEPALVVTPTDIVRAVLALPCADLGDQLLPEALPRQGVALRQSHGNPERAALPWRLEDELPVGPRRRRRAFDI